MKCKAFLFSLALGVSFGALFGITSKASAAVEASVGSYSRNQSTYYTSAFTNKVTSTMYDDDLAETLQKLMFETHGTYNTYDDLWTYTKYTDTDLDNPDNIILVYSRQSVDGSANTATWNREHVWCKSLSGGLYTKDTVKASTIGAGSDIHHLRPASTAYNSTRGNTPYGIVATHNGTTQMGDTDCYMTGEVFEPADYIKGDVARILMYMYVHYSNEVDGSDDGKRGALAITNIVSTAAGTAQSAWDLLMDWNEFDPVDYSEMVRNNQCCYYLGNYNPFIDHPEYARMIWDDSSSDQAGLCFQTSYKEVSVSGQYTNTASAFGNVSSAGEIVYTSDCPDVATVDSGSGKVTGISNGVARIKARATINGINRISYSFVKVGSGYAPKHTLKANGVVYTPTSTNSAKASETLVSESVSYSNTYTSSGSHSQITKDNVAQMTITNFPKTVSAITLSMHSNQSSGAGTITVTIGGSSYYSATGNFSSIYGSYSQSYVPLVISNPSAAVKTGTIVITISASANSLFFGKAVVDYSERIITNATGISVSPSSAKLTPGEDIFLSTSFTPSTTTLKEVTWSSSNSSVATVNKYGLVRAVSTGEATITATAKDGSGTTGTSTISVISSIDPIPDPTSISAVSNKTYYVGDTIAKADLTVTDDLGNDIDDFTFADDGYRFTYADAASGGALTNKTFASSITHDELSCNLTVQVQRNRRLSEITDTLTKATTGISGSGYKDWSNKTDNSSAVYAGNSYGSYDSIQLRSSDDSGLITTSSGGLIRTISVVWEGHTADGRTINVYGSDTAYSSTSDLYDEERRGALLGTISYGTSTSLTVTGDYAYVGIRSSSGALYMTSVSFTYGSVGSAASLADFIMYEDTENQCLAKYAEAKDYFGDMSASQRASFATSSDYVISTARARLNAWASHQGEELIYLNGEYVLSSSAFSAHQLSQMESDNSNIITLIAVIEVGALASIFVLARRKEERE